MTDTDTAVMTLDEMSAAIRTSYARARRHDRLKWEHYFRVGSLLNEARERFPSDRQFGQWCAQAFPFGHSWRNQLQRLGRRADEVRDLLSSAPEGSESIGVDAMLDLLDGRDRQRKPSHAEVAGHDEQGWIDGPEDDPTVIYVAIAGVEGRYRPVGRETRDGVRRLAMTDPDGAYAAVIAKAVSMAHETQARKALETAVLLDPSSFIWRSTPTELDQWADLSRRLRVWLDVLDAHLLGRHRSDPAIDGIAKGQVGMGLIGGTAEPASQRPVSEVLGRATAMDDADPEDVDHVLRSSGSPRPGSVLAVVGATSAEISRPGAPVAARGE
jgi:hypothetical protein